MDKYNYRRQATTKMKKTKIETENEKPEDDKIELIPTYDHKDESFNYLINMKIEEFLSPDNIIIKILKNKDYTIIISEVKSNRDNNSIIFTKTLEVFVCTNKYLELRSSIRFEFCKKFTLIIKDKLREIHTPSIKDKDVEFPLNFFLICDKFLLIDCPIQLIICDFIKQNYSTLLVKTYKRFFNPIFTYDELIKSPSKGVISLRNYVFGLNHNKALYYFIIEDNIFKTIELYPKLKLILRKIPIDKSSTIKDLKVNLYLIQIIKISNSNCKSWYYLICFLTEDEFIYYITDYSTLSLEKVFYRIFKLNQETKNKIDLKKNSYLVKRINIFLNDLGMSSIIISNGDNLILIEFDATYNPDMLRSRLKVGQLIGLVKNRNPDNNNDNGKTYYFDTDLKFYNVKNFI